MVCILGAVVGGFVFFLSLAIRKENNDQANDKG
ncbi:hypothetical protein [Reichenbachiella sp. 5M10]|nr:hypothetical protein [Reichenbachiella sp. 5M10]